MHTVKIKLTNFINMIASVTSNKREMNTLLEVKTQEKSLIHIYTLTVIIQCKLKHC